MKKADIDIYGQAIRFFLNGSTVYDLEEGMKEVFDCLGQQTKTAENPEELYLQTFTNVMHRDELEFFLQRGFYINNVMLFMELDITELSEDETDLVNVEIYDVSKGFEEYLEANELGFGEQDPPNQIEEELSFPNAAIYVVREEGRIVSSVTVWDVDDDVLATENIFTIPEYRGRKLAWNLLKHILLTKRVKGYNKARLSVFGDDFEALSMYYKMGFTLTKEKYELRY
ncbi:MAG: GNAT family N-acetyltransferase [Lachnospiraceae bacterium]|nr:GNAT family N-acetyltransferase [Lachnospiraceae bacterium]